MINSLRSQDSFYGKDENLRSCLVVCALCLVIVSLLLVQLMSYTMRSALIFSTQFAIFLRAFQLHNGILMLRQALN